MKLDDITGYFRRAMGSTDKEVEPIKRDSTKALKQVERSMKDNRDLLLRNGITILIVSAMQGDNHHGQ